MTNYLLNIRRPVHTNTFKHQAEKFFRSLFFFFPLWFFFMSNYMLQSAFFTFWKLKTCRCRCNMLQPFISSAILFKKKKKKSLFCTAFGRGLNEHICFLLLEKFYNITERSFLKCQTRSTIESWKIASPPMKETQWTIYRC